MLWSRYITILKTAGLIYDAHYSSNKVRAYLIGWMWRLMIHKKQLKRTFEIVDISDRDIITMKTGNATEWIIYNKMTGQKVKPSMNQLTKENIDDYLCLDQFGNDRTPSFAEVLMLMRDLESEERYELCAYLRDKYLKIKQ